MTTSRAASSTVTDWANTSQSRFMSRRCFLGGRHVGAPITLWIVLHMVGKGTDASRLTHVNAQSSASQ
jgi:hypothetical protein